MQHKKETCCHFPARSPRCARPALVLTAPGTTMHGLTIYCAYWYCTVVHTAEREREIVGSGQWPARPMHENSETHSPRSNRSGIIKTVCCLFFPSRKQINITVLLFAHVYDSRRAYSNPTRFVVRHARESREKQSENTRKQEKEAHTSYFTLLRSTSYFVGNFGRWWFKSLQINIPSNMAPPSPHDSAAPSLHAACSAHPSPLLPPSRSKNQEQPRTHTKHDGRDSRPPAVRPRSFSTTTNSREGYKININIDIIAARNNRARAPAARRAQAVISHYLLMKLPGETGAETLTWYRPRSAAGFTVWRSLWGSFVRSRHEALLLIAAALVIQIYILEYIYTPEKYI